MGVLKYLNLFMSQVIASTWPMYQYWRGMNANIILSKLRLFHIKETFHHGDPKASNKVIIMAVIWIILVVFGKSFCNIPGSRKGELKYVRCHQLVLSSNKFPNSENRERDVVVTVLTAIWNGCRNWASKRTTNKEYTHFTCLEKRQNSPLSKAAKRNLHRPFQVRSQIDRFDCLWSACTVNLAFQGLF